MTAPALSTGDILAARFARHVNQLSETNGTTPQGWIRSLWDQQAAAKIKEYNRGVVVLRHYSLHRFGTYQALAIAEDEENKLLARGYNTLIEMTLDNRYDLYGLKLRPVGSKARTQQQP